MPSSRTARRPRAVAPVAAGALLAIATTTLLLYANSRLDPDPGRLSKAEEDLARAAYESHESSSPSLGEKAPRLFAPRALPTRDAVAADSPGTRVPEPRARSAIVVSVATGEVLLERNADESIPPASMTKLVAMYVALDAARSGEISLDDAFEPPPDSWAVNLPPRSSLMFLGEGQVVTTRELLSGMASVSGNDAAIAIAHLVSGSVTDFVGRMNETVEALGLVKTRFFEPSGLSERNSTTAREFASFCLAYLSEFPETLAAFHSLRDFAYPLDRNYPDGRRAATVWQPATNRMLGTLPGCDGLKTGYIDESGYNIALTATRDGERYLAVIMGGAGADSREGNRIRTEDGTAIMDWAFANWTTLALGDVEPVPVTVWGGGSLFAIPAGAGAVTVPSVPSDGIPPHGGVVDARVVTDQDLAAPVRAGDVVGCVEYSIDGRVAYRRPLVADRTIRESSPPVRALDAIAKALAPLVRYR